MGVFFIVMVTACRIEITKGETTYGKGNNFNSNLNKVKRNTCTHTLFIGKYSELLDYRLINP